MTIYTVLRTANERSLPLAKQALSEQSNSYAIIEEYPFSAALKKMFLLAKEQDYPYLLALDADVILHEGALKKIQAYVEASINPDLFFVDFFVMDKFRGKCCSGCHLYINRYSQELFDELCCIEENETRPENDLVLNFSKKTGLIHKSASLIAGLHDFEQYYKDLYAKFFRRAQRRPQELKMLIETILLRKQYFPNDPDFEVVLKGLEDGSSAKNSAPFDARLYQEIHTIMPLREKSAILPLI